MTDIDQIRSIKASAAERETLLDQLRVWAEAKEQGIEPESVERFAFNVSLLEDADFHWHRKATSYCYQLSNPAMRNAPEWVGVWLFEPGHPEWFNCVKLTDGTIKQLSPMIRAAKG